ncbi:RNA methyltransferase [Hyphomicrobium methylovorum]|uniref:TrmH family RNA methyltransferase n=1 Tax=Hyphomicrobium methylovorum TaxID=84 RepID=UPI0015E7C4D2|nr:RNA methyltransferase [Hyphomicrobium methylovorum]MBA2125369.1 RNA methyltransferase [Hyphomicrobium methylovorum]
MNEPKIITSLTNDRVKAIRALDMRKVRKETGLFVAEGASLLVTARDHGFVPETLVYQTGTAATGIARGLVTHALSAGAEVLEVSEAVLTKLSSKDNPQTLLGVFRQQFAPPPDLTSMSHSDTWLALEEIRDPGNLGTIIRTADAVGAAGVILVGTTCDPYALDAVRATMGSIFAVPIVKMDRPQFTEFAKRWPGDAIGTHLTARHDFRSETYRGPQLIVMGGEGPGLSTAVAAVCSKLVKIPMAGNLDSLNLAVATALMLYQVRGPQLKL